MSVRPFCVYHSGLVAKVHTPKGAAQIYKEGLERMNGIPIRFNVEKKNYILNLIKLYLKFSPL